jgi:hypothetical protein
MREIVSFTTEERILNRLGPGDYFGEVSLMEPGGLRTASVRALSGSKLLEMTRDNFGRLLQRRPAIAFHIAETGCGMNLNPEQFPTYKFLFPVQTTRTTAF